MPDAVVLVEKFNGTFLEDEMYPTMPRPPVQAMQGQVPAQQFGYMPTPMEQGIGALANKPPTYGSQPSYMAQGGTTSSKGQMMPPMQGISQQTQMGMPFGVQAAMPSAVGPEGEMAASAGDFAQQQAIQQGMSGKGQIPQMPSGFEQQQRMMQQARPNPVPQQMQPYGRVPQAPLQSGLYSAMMRQR